jgi:D-galactarolactone isomerase
MSRGPTVPAGACDCHIHAYDSAYPLAPTASAPAPLQATLADYAKLQQRLGLSRVVVVQPTAYGFDNRCTLAAVAALGDRARAVVMLAPTVSEDVLMALHAAGVRGVRMMMLAPGLFSWDGVAALAARLRPLGWHMNFQFDGRQFVQRLPLLQGLDLPLVVDHTGKFLEPPGLDDPAFLALCRLLDGGRTWVKLSAPYETSRAGPPHYEDVGRLARHLAAHYPERCLWASNWPHPGQSPVPDSAALLDLLPTWVARSRDVERILLDNPARLYGFAA